MSKQVQQYLKQIEAKNYPNNNNIIVFDREEVRYPQFKVKWCQAKIGDVPIYLKSNNPNALIFSQASSEMYNSVDIPTPYGFLCKIADSEDLFIGTQDINTLPNDKFNFTQGDETKIYKRKLRGNTFYHIPSKWTILNNETDRQTLLEDMTEECLEEFINILLADELRADNDRHWGNLFFYKEKEADKFQGIIVIDIDNTRLLRQASENPKLAFNLFKYNDYISWTALQYSDNTQSYSKRIKRLRKLINKNNLSGYNCQTLKDVLNYDLPKRIKELGKKYSLEEQTKFIYDTTSMLWEYNNKNIGRELGL